MPDTIETLGQSLIQHGKDNDRIYLMKLAEQDVSTITERLDALAQTHDYGKIFCKVPASAAQTFTNAGYEQEAVIARFYQDRIDLTFMSRFRDPERKKISAPDCERIDQILALAQQKADQMLTLQAPPTLIRPLVEIDVPLLSQLYRRVFPSYPFPIMDPQYLHRTMQSHVLYYGVFMNKQLWAAASAEVDVTSQSAEMTDFATHPKHRRKGLAQVLLKRMERDLRDVGLRTVYTIARALSTGMNITFARSAYQFAGTLVNNTQIAGKIESMNVWYKPLTQRE
jgi:putative beta-lysine N-acetyltransferase